MTFKVYAYTEEPGTEDLEIAQAGQLHVASATMPLITSCYFVGTKQYWNIQPTMPTDFEVRLRQAQVPVPPSVNPFTTATVPKKDYDNMKLVLAVLVDQMGGAVTFYPQDLLRVKQSNFKYHEYRDPAYIELKLED